MEPAGRHPAAGRPRLGDRRPGRRRRARRRRPPAARVAAAAASRPGAAGSWARTTRIPRLRPLTAGIFEDLRLRARSRRHRPRARQRPLPRLRSRASPRSPTAPRSRMPIRRSSRRCAPRSATPAATTGSSARSTAGAAAGRQWIIDPIDGTTNFLRGLPVWAHPHRARGRRRAGDRRRRRPRAAAPLVGRAGNGAWTATVTDTRRRAPPAPVSQVAGARATPCSATTRSRAGTSAGGSTALLALARSCWRSRAPRRLLVVHARRGGAARHRRRARPEGLRHGRARADRGGGGRPVHLPSTGEPGPWHGTALATNGLLHEAALEKIGLRTSHPDARRALT